MTQTTIPTAEEATVLRTFDPTATPTMLSIEYRRQEPVTSLVFPGHGVAAREGWDAEVEVDGARLGFSRLVGEDGWTLDSFTPKGSGCPAFMNGWGARYLRTDKAADSLSAWLDEQATVAHLATGEGPDEGQAPEAGALLAGSIEAAEEVRQTGQPGELLVLINGRRMLVTVQEVRR